MSSADDDTSTSKISEMRGMRRSLDDLDFYTTCLMDLLPSMEQTCKKVCDPPLHLKETSGMVSSHSTKAARRSVLQIRDRFKNAATSLVEHLGEMNWQRSVRIRQQMGIDAKESEVVDSQLDTYPASFPVSGFHDSGLGNFLSSKASSMPSSASSSALASSVARNESDFTRIPSTPHQVARGIPFVCFICKRILKEIRNSVDWE